MWNRCIFKHYGGTAARTKSKSDMSGFLVVNFNFPGVEPIRQGVQVDLK